MYTCKEGYQTVLHEMAEDSPNHMLGMFHEHVSTDEKRMEFLTDTLKNAINGRNIHLVKKCICWTLHLVTDIYVSVYLDPFQPSHHFVRTWKMSDEAKNQAFKEAGRVRAKKAMELWDTCHDLYYRVENTVWQKEVVEILCKEIIHEWIQTEDEEDARSYRTFFSKNLNKTMETLLKQGYGEKVSSVWLGEQISKLIDPSENYPSITREGLVRLLFVMWSKRVGKERLYKLFPIISDLSLVTDSAYGFVNKVAEKIGEFDRKLLPLRTVFSYWREDNMKNPSSIPTGYNQIPRSQIKSVSFISPQEVKINVVVSFKEKESNRTKQLFSVAEKNAQLWRKENPEYAVILDITFYSGGVREEFLGNMIFRSDNT